MSRKRYLLVDTLGLIWAIVVHPADVQDRDGTKWVLRKVTRRWLYRVRRIWADGIDKGTFVEWAWQQYRWIVERTFAWFGHYQWLGKDYELHPSIGETMIYLAMSYLMLKRVARA